MNTNTMMMKTMNTKKAPGAFGAALLCAALTVLFPGCPAEPDTTGFDGIEISLPINGTGARHHYALSTGQEVASPSGTNWDIALEAHDGAFFVLTNSGVSATPGGQGGVWFTNETSFDAVTRADQAVTTGLGEYEPYTADVTRYVMVMAADPVKQNLNVITYAGYPGGDGLTPATHFPYNAPDMANMGTFVPYNFNKKQAYTMEGMPPTYTPTMQVYIVRHGDGAAHSKVQLSDVYREPGDPSHFVMRLRHAAVE